MYFVEIYCERVLDVHLIMSFRFVFYSILSVCDPPYHFGHRAQNNNTYESRNFAQNHKQKLHSNHIVKTVIITFTLIFLLFFFRTVKFKFDCGMCLWLICCYVCVFVWSSNKTKTIYIYSMKLSIRNKCGKIAFCGSIEIRCAPI